MSKKPLILGIETSCDETAASLVTENEDGMPVVLSNIISSQVDVHKEFGGVVPELAARSHMEKIDWIVQKAINDSGRKIEEIDAVASTAGPGLIVCLSVGLSFGKAFAASLEKPFIAVNHLEGHALSPKLNSKLNYPYLLLLISGGHSQFLNVQGIGMYKRLGTTIDDALGEAFDKTAKLLGIDFPGGPQIEVLAKKGDSNKYNLPKPIFNKGGCKLIRGNVDTRIKKLNDGLYDAIILSYAGIESLKLNNLISEIFSVSNLIPSAGQGIISIQCREDNDDIISILKKINHDETYQKANAERNVLKVLEGDCETAIGAHAIVEGNKIILEAELFSLDGKQRFYEKKSSEIENAKELGKEVGQILKTKSNNSYKK